MDDNCRYVQYLGPCPTYEDPTWGTIDGKCETHGPVRFFLRIPSTVFQYGLDKSVRERMMESFEAICQPIS